MIKELRVKGLRGFENEQSIVFSLPNEKTKGSGLTIITGANNSGKTTIVEAIRSFNGNKSPSFSEGQRNNRSGVDISIVDESGAKFGICSVSGDGSTTKRDSAFNMNYFILPSRRAISYDFGKSDGNRDYYVSLSNDKIQRSNMLSRFEMRIFKIEKEKSKFDLLLKRILGADFEWVIELRDNGMYYIKYTYKGKSHSSEGVGDGIWSVFTICDALYDAEEKSTIVIDEPELSLHPSLQRKVMSVLLDYSVKMQIIICTHSPYFINWQALSDGAGLVRVVKNDSGSSCFCLSDKRRDNIKGFMKDLNNPHVLGLDANEVFFLDDNIILVEGQEDVVIYKKIVEELDISFEGSFYGWGVGGATKMRFFMEMFRDLGYKHVVAILDGDKEEEAKDLMETFPEYCVQVLPTNDIRDKRERSLDSKNGITKENGEIKDEYRTYISKLFEEINDYIDS